MTDEELELTCFSLISSAGTAKSRYIGAMRAAREGRFDEASSMIDEGDRILADGHAPHAAMVQREAAGDRAPVNILLIHAEDQMAAAETFRVTAEELIEVYGRLARVGA